MVSIRGATEADLDRLVEVHGASYPDDRTAAARKLNFTQNALGRLGDLRVAVIGKRIVGHGFGFPLRAWFGGATVPVCGIASIAVAPEARGQGVARALMTRLEKEARGRGAVLSILHAFRHRFYARLGYAGVAANLRLVCDPRAIPRAWIDAARAANLGAARAPDVKTMSRIYEHAAKRETGWLARPESLWTRMLTREQVYFVVLSSKGHDAGFVAFEMSQREDHDETRIVVRDFVAQDDDTRRTLWGFLGMQADQAAAIEIETRIDDPIAFALTDIDGGRFGTARVEHELGGVVAGPMVRMLDVRAALSARGFASDGEVDLVVDKKPMRVVVKDGAAKIRKGETRGALSLDARTLASIAFGGLRVTDAARLGLVRTRSKETLTAADALLRIPPFFTVDRF